MCILGVGEDISILCIHALLILLDCSGIAL